PSARVRCGKAALEERFARARREEGERRCDASQDEKSDDREDAGRSAARADERALRVASPRKRRERAGHEPERHPRRGGEGSALGAGRRLLDPRPSRPERSKREGERAAQRDAPAEGPPRAQSLARPRPKGRQGQAADRRAESAHRSVSAASNGKLARTSSRSSNATPARISGSAPATRRPGGRRRRRDSFSAGARPVSATSQARSSPPGASTRASASDPGSIDESAARRSDGSSRHGPSGRLAASSTTERAEREASPRITRKRSSASPAVPVAIAIGIAAYAS